MPQNPNDPARLPFRQTCNRCRQLKVRCKGLTPDSALDTESAAESRYTAGLSCSRCLRAGAICTYSSKERSGRPRVEKSQRRSSSSSAAMLAALTPASTTNDSPEPFQWTTTSQDSLSPSPQLFQAKDPKMADFLTVDEPQCLGADSSSSTLSDTGNLFHHGADFSSHIFDEAIPDLISECPGPAQAVPQLQLPETRLEAEDIDDSVLKDTAELTELNKGIYRLQLRSRASEFPMTGLCDDMTSATHSLVEVIARLLRRQNPHTTQLHRQQDQVSRTPTISMTLGTTPHTTKNNVDPTFCSQTNRMSLYLDDDNNDIDISTILLIFACYQRLCDLFKQTSLSMQVYIQTNGTSLSSKGQMVMTAELMTYLIGRLEPVLFQLTTGRGPVTTAPMATSVTHQFHDMIDSDDLNGLVTGGRLRNGLRDGVHTPGLSNKGVPASYPLGLSLIVHKMHQLRIALQAHISMIKQAVRESDIM